MGQITISVWFVCKLCRGSFRQVDDFIEHKKKEHFTQFQNISCIYFEEMKMEHGLQCPFEIKDEINLTDENIEPPIKIEVDDEDTTIPFSFETNNEPNFDLVEPKSELITYDSEINPNSGQNYFSVKEPEQNPYVLLKRLTAEEIQSACSSKQHSRLLRFEQKNLPNTSEPHNSSDVDISYNDQDPVINISTELDLQFECKLCSKQLESNAHLRTHVEICALNHKDRNRFCVTCNKKLSDPNCLQRHCLRYHGTEEEKASLFKFKCHLCPKQYKMMRDLCYHLECHKAEKKQVKSSGSSSFKPKHFKCSQPNCGKEFKRNQELRRHTATHFGLKPFSCSNCNKTFSYNWSLKEHLRIHTGERPYKCTVDNCKESFARSRDRSYHHETVHGISYHT